MPRRHAHVAFRIALRTLKWGTLAAAMLVAGVWAGGRYTACDVVRAVGDRVVQVSGLPGGMVIRDHSYALVGIWDMWQPAFDERYRVWWPSFTKEFGTVDAIRIPYWLPILPFASISGGLFWRDRRASRRAKTGHCPSCGYSRAGLALDAVCPECGKAKA